MPDRKAWLSYNFFKTFSELKKMFAPPLHFRFFASVDLIPDNIRCVLHFILAFFGE